jgi:hypothetical protein
MEKDFRKFIEETTDELKEKYGEDITICEHSGIAFNKKGEVVV